ncbi:hypothetical protein L6452_22290 [Arctium lappa]|uniref:Uncharacterized protein n=1 Tax=Arctium lappa TaxID=4217 RepID=A0ACB9AZD9_ARCLA|nr:hypothetical protein L6452_22290 [Arctium lappa]
MCNQNQTEKYEVVDVHEDIRVFESTNNDVLVVKMHEESRVNEIQVNDVFSSIEVGETSRQFHDIDVEIANYNMEFDCEHSNDPGFCNNKKSVVVRSALVRADLEENISFKRKINKLVWDVHIGH